MNEETIVAVYDTAAHAEAVIRDLEGAGVPASAISRHAASAETTTGVEPSTSRREPGFWESIFGGEPDHDTAVYDRSLEGGSQVVTVRVPDEQVDNVVSILERHDPVDMDERAKGYGLTTPGLTTSTTHEALGTTPAAGAAAGYGLGGAGSATTTPGGALGTPQTSTAGAAAGVAGRKNLSADDTEKLQLAEEQLTVGKRLVNRGTTRIRRFVVETPVQEDVSLHSERVSVDRRPVTGDARVTDPDFTEKTVEVAETDEEAIVGKTARVREEVVVRKDAADRVETVRDTVRRQDVEITKDGAVDRGRTTSDPVPPVRP